MVDSDSSVRDEIGHWSKGLDMSVQERDFESMS